MKKLFEFYYEDSIESIEAEVMEDTPKNRNIFVESRFPSKDFADNNLESFIDGTTDDSFTTIISSNDWFPYHGVRFRVITLENKLDELEDKYLSDRGKLFDMFKEEDGVRQVIPNDISPI